MKLFILEGCHAVGKTTMLSKLEEEKCDVTLKTEGYFDLKRFECNSIFHQIDWLLDWLHSILKFKTEGKKIVISDRGPITSIIYGGYKFKFIVDEIYDTLKQNNISVINLYMSSPNKEELINRIVNRSGPLVDLELKNLEIVLNNYENVCREYIKINDIIDLKKALEEII